MSDRRSYTVLLLLILTISLNQGQKVKANDRRAAAGLVPYPRIGRDSRESNDFSRPDRALGLVHYPRVGRSDFSYPIVNSDRYHVFIPDNDLESYSTHDTDDSNGPMGFDQVNYRQPVPFAKHAGLRHNQGQLMANGYLPRLVRETENISFL